MRNAPLIISLLIHGLIIALAYVNFGDMLSTKIKDSGHAVFDFVEIGSKSKAPVLSSTNSRVSKTRSQSSEKDETFVNNMEDAPKAQEQTKQEGKKDNTPPDKDQRDDKAVALDKPKKPQQKPKLEAEQKPSKKPDKKTGKSKSSKANDKAVVNLQPKKKLRNHDQKAAKKSLDSLLEGAMADDAHENAGLNAEEVGEALTATQIDLIRQTIRKCWHFPAGLKNAEDLVVDVEMELAPDGKITKAVVVDKKRMDRDPDFKIAAESAVRAVMDDKCNNLTLPKEKYDEWKNITLSFNPKDMLMAW
ncbi:MAG: cell envelope integrity protein TolA [Holosporales bacterium]|jgi:outer membrane biosynthesis protein TonB|nr:cell envelope integrity protein TolA [Holosporales bacterium]